MDNGLFITEADNDDFGPILSCLLSQAIGLDGDERPIDAMFAALDGALNAEDGCNEGFHRPGTPLVTIFVSDVDDENSLDDPDQWFANLMALNNSDDTLLATVGMLGPSDLTGCPSSVDSCARLRAFVDKHLLSHRATINICDPNTDNLVAAVQQIWQAICPEAG
jgi:hypothetical protein